MPQSSGTFTALPSTSPLVFPPGPAVRFIEAALARMGYRQLPKHIESALHDRVDWANEFLRRRLDELMI
jgi:hypothetical protein